MEFIISENLLVLHLDETILNQVKQNHEIHILKIQVHLYRDHKDHEAHEDYNENNKKLKS